MLVYSSLIGMVTLIENAIVCIKIKFTYVSYLAFIIHVINDFFRTVFIILQLICVDVIATSKTNYMWFKVHH